MPTHHKQNFIPVPQEYKEEMQDKKRQEQKFSLDSQQVVFQMALKSDFQIWTFNKMKDDDKITMFNVVFKNKLPLRDALNKLFDLFGGNLEQEQRNVFALSFSNPITFREVKQKLREGFSPAP